MDDDGGLGIRNWGYYDPPIKRNLGLQLMSSVSLSNSTERDTKPLLSNNGGNLNFLHHRGDCGGVNPPAQHGGPMNLIRSDAWAQHTNRFNSTGSKLLHHPLPLSHTHSHSHHPANYSLISENSLHMMHHSTTPTQKPSENDQIAPILPDPNPQIPQSDTPIKKRAQPRTPKSPKPKKPRKTEPANGAAPRGKNPNSKKDTGMVINGIDLDLSRIPTPVCSCTGSAQQCYRWGVGGWQSACCTTSISMYPLPMSTKRRGSRIAGRKMSHGAFKKVLEKLAGEGYNLANPIDLRGFWAKHGTNKFVTIR